VIRSWAPGCGRSLRTITRIPFGHAWPANLRGHRRFDKCDPAFAAYVGRQREDSLLDYLDYLVPHEWDWKPDKVTLICLVL
jgi:hypothetical protein